MSLIRILIDSSTACIGRVRRGKRITPEKDIRDGSIKINLGCGLAVTSGWINVDASLNALFASWPKILHRLLYRLSGANRYYSLEQYCNLLEKNVFIHHDLSDSIPLKDSTADFIYTSHFLEHLFKKDAERLLKECHRVLKPGGIVRVCVPDLSYAVSLYLHGEKTKMLDNFFFNEDKESYLARHKYMYDYELLKTQLENAGFATVVRCDYRQGQTPNIDKLDNRSDDTLFVEAIKL